MESPPLNLKEKIQMSTPFFDAPANGTEPEIDITPAWSTGGRLAGTVALVTGASSGIGAATANALAAQGASVALAARRTDRLEKLAAEIRERGGTALVIESDITDEQQAVGAVERTVAEFGRLDTLINNAGVMLLGPVVGRADHRVAADGRPERDGPALHRPRGPAAPAHGRRRRPTPGRRHGERQFRGRARGTQRPRRLQPHQARHRRVQRVAAPGGHPQTRTRVAGRARRDRHRAGRRTTGTRSSR